MDSDRVSARAFVRFALRAELAVSWNSAIDAE